MKSKINFLIMILLFAIIKSYSQVSVSIEDVTINSQTIVNNCNTIDFGTVSNNSLSFFFKLSKSSSFTPDGTLKIMLKYSSSTNGSERANQIFQSTNWSIDGTSAEGYISCNIAASEIQVSGSTIYLEYTTNGSSYTSCVYPLIKTQVPEFDISPTSINLLCGSTIEREFTAVNVHSSPGTVSYSWNVGTGWKLNGVAVIGTFTTTNNSITLEPSSPIVLPSSVTMTATLAGVQYPTKTSTISRTDIIETITSMSGASIVCNGAFAYTLNGNCISVSTNKC